MPKTYAIIAGGGTAGHVNPGLAIADALVERGHDKDSIHFVGAKRGLEAKLVTEARYSITLLPGRGITRRVSVASVAAVLSLLVALVEAFFVVRRLKPDVLVSVGGYAAAPAAFAAVMLRVPIVLAESNAVPGAVNRLLGRFAKASAVALPGTKLPRAVVTGNPVHKELTHIDRSSEARLDAKSALGIPTDRLLVSVFGGSLGSRTINLAVIDLAQQWKDRADVAIRHALGRRDWQKPDVPGYDGGGEVVYHPIEYEAQRVLMYQASDVIVTRAGSTTVAEIAAAGVPAILVPLPHSPGDHQTANATALETEGAAMVIADSDCTGSNLDSILTSLLNDEPRRLEMSTAALALAKPDAAANVASVIEDHARR